MSLLHSCSLILLISPLVLLNSLSLIYFPSFMEQLVLLQLSPFPQDSSYERLSFVCSVLMSLLITAHTSEVSKEMAKIMLKILSLDGSFIWHTNNRSSSQKDQEHLQDNMEGKLEKYYTKSTILKFRKFNIDKPQNLGFKLSLYVFLSYRTQCVSFFLLDGKHNCLQFVRYFRCNIYSDLIHIPVNTFSFFINAYYFATKIKDILLFMFYQEARMFIQDL